MHAKICTHAWQRSRSRCFVITLILLFISTSALAQNGRPRSKKPEAELHVRVNVIPVVMRPPHKKHREDSGVSYNLMDQKQYMDIKEEIHLLVRITGSGGTTNAVLKTVTIVLQ